MTARAQRGRCESGKVRFRNRGAVRQAIDRRRQRFTRDTFGACEWTPLYAYRCPLCRGWHMTRQDPSVRIDRGAS